MWLSRLFWKLFWPHAALLLLWALIIVGIDYGWQAPEVSQQFQSRLEDMAATMARLVPTQPPADTDWQTLAEQLGQSTGAWVTFYSAGGDVLADSRDPATVGSNQLRRPEVAAALERGQAGAQREPTPPENSIRFQAVRVEGVSSPVRLVRVGLPMEPIQAAAGNIAWLICLATGGYLIVALGVTYLMARSTVLPVRQLAAEMEQLAAGEQPEPVYVGSFDEIGLLADRFNRMSRQIGARLGELNDSRDRMATVLGNMIEGVIAVDERERVLFANDAAGTLLDFSPTAAVGRPLMESVRNHVLHEAVSTAFAAQGMRSVVPRTLVLESPTSSQTLSINTTRLPGKPCPGVVLVMHDVTELRRLENLRQEFVANVSHELKTPLSSIKAYAETLKNGALADQDHNHVFVARIEEQADRLHQLIIDMLSLARIESGQQAFDIVRIELGPIVDEVCEQALPAAEEKQLRMRVESPGTACQVRADEEGVREILTNLISNAIKYTPVGGDICVRYRTEHKQVVIEVADTGIGIPIENQARIFERFYRVDRARSRELGGTGLGLSIVKHLCLALGGSVGVKSKPGAGSTFTVRLPAG